ncbi:hypothetical protein M885DRAFT_543079 [Pelagophyceae sp. CCMP2097]|nr:hypothetical protein M885DRAFT_543079 [Pelagophyceae sp. CCMP2097]
MDVDKAAAIVEKYDGPTAKSPKKGKALRMDRRYDASQGQGSPAPAATLRAVSMRQTVPPTDAFGIFSAAAGADVAAPAPAALARDVRVVVDDGPSWRRAPTPTPTGSSFSRRQARPCHPSRTCCGALPRRRRRQAPGACAPRTTCSPTTSATRRSRAPSKRRCRPDRRCCTSRSSFPASPSPSSRSTPRSASWRSSAWHHRFRRWPRSARRSSAAACTAFASTPTRSWSTSSSTSARASRGSTSSATDLPRRRRSSWAISRSSS